MSNPESVTPRQTTRSHLTPFTEGPRAWMVLLRNAIPVVGVYWLHWSVDVICFQIWFSGVTALGAMLAFQTRAFAQNDEDALEMPPEFPKSFQPGVPAAFWLFFLVNPWCSVLVHDSCFQPPGIQGWLLAFYPSSRNYY